MDKPKILIFLSILFFAYVALVCAQDINRKVGIYTTTKRVVTRRTTTTLPQTFEANCTLEFAAFKVRYNKRYFNASDEAYHKAIFCKTLKEIYDHNANKSSPFRLGLNPDSDIDPAVNPRNNGLKVNDTEVQNSIKSKKVKALPPIKPNRKVGGLTYKHLGNWTGPVKDQGGCGSCWAYSAIAVTQYDAWKNGNINVTLSEQDLLDCNEYGGSCDGANPMVGLIYGFLHGVATQATYPYRQKQGPCKRPDPKIPPKWQPKNVCTAMMKGDDRAYAQILDAYGPILIAIAMTGNINNYRSGVYNDAASCGTQINHGVVLVGYGTDPVEGDYWIIKNSWGPLWGEDGYFRIKAGVNMCGVGYGVFVICPA